MSWDEEYKYNLEQDNLILKECIKHEKKYTKDLENRNLFRRIFNVKPKREKWIRVATPYRFDDSKYLKKEENKVIKENKTMELKKLQNILSVIEDEVNKIEATNYATEKCKIEIVISKELWDKLTEMSDLTADKYLHSNKMFGNIVCYQMNMPIDTFHIKYRIKENK